MDAIFLFAQLARWSTIYSLLEKDHHVPNGRAEFLCFGFGFDFLDVSQRKSDAPAKVVCLDFSRTPPPSESHWGELPALSELRWC
jgi:hypothetical protein